jgi:pilus assembly protein CpaB
VSSRRTIILVAAIVVAALATYVLLNYVRGVEEKAKPNPVTVYAISEEIKRGMPGVEVKSTHITKKVIPSEYRPETFINDLNELDGKVAVIDLAPGQILVQGMFVESERANTSFKDKITGDNVAVALPFDTVRAVGGYIKPGDEVNLLMVDPVAETTSGTTAAATPTGSAAQAVARPQLMRPVSKASPTPTTCATSTKASASSRSAPRCCVRPVKRPPPPPPLRAPSPKAPHRPA